MWLNDAEQSHYHGEGHQGCNFDQETSKVAVGANEIVGTLGGPSVSAHISPLPRHFLKERPSCAPADLQLQNSSFSHVTVRSLLRRTRSATQVRVRKALENKPDVAVIDREHAVTSSRPMHDVI
jgi:hypothetical protein